MGNWSFSICLLVMVAGRLVFIPHASFEDLLGFGMIWTAVIELLAWGWRSDERRPAIAMETRRAIDSEAGVVAKP